MEERIQTRSHKMLVQNRGTANITGVKDVVSFDVNEVLLETELGMLTIRGKELHVSRLTVEKGEIDIDGRIDSFSYSDNTPASKSAQSFVSRLFK